MNESTTKGLQLACFNVRSLGNKLPGVIELLKDKNIAVCCITESWLKVKDSAKFAEIHDYGFDIFSAPRKGKGGGVAFIFNPEIVKPVRNNVTTYSSFEILECVIQTTTLLRLCVVYRCTQVKSQDTYCDTKLSKFMIEFEDYLDSLLTKNGAPIICGDFNIHVENDNDKAAQNFKALYESRGFIQHVGAPTHVAGGTLDLVLTRENVADAIPIRNISVNPDTGTSSDHYFVSFNAPYQTSNTQSARKEEKEIRYLNKIDVEKFRADLESSLLSSKTYQSLDEAVSLYTDVLQCTLDLHAPVVRKKFKVTKSPWWNRACQEACTERRRAERAMKKAKKRQENVSETKKSYKDTCVQAASVIENARNDFYRSKLNNLTGDPRGTYKVINSLLDKEYGADKIPNGESDEKVANSLKDFFDNKVKQIYSNISQDSPQNSDIDILNGHQVPDSDMSAFRPITKPELLEVIKEMPNKACALDPIPMWLFRNCLPELIDIVHYIINESLRTGTFPTSLKTAMVRPGLKKPSLDSDELKNYRPISNLTYLSKIIEKIVHKQISQYVETHDLFSKYQSGYRKSHGCETAVTKIHNDILLMVDKRDNVVLLLLDLSAAFDTINHELLLKKLNNMYGIKGKVQQWLESYLSDRKFKVVVKSSSSGTCLLEIGVPQGSILGPLLFILYTKDLEAIVTRYGFSVHLYADDTQVYFSLDVHSENPDLTAVSRCFAEIKAWMAVNYLKLNETKTEFMDIGLYKSPITSLNLDGVMIESCKKARNLGFMFDHTMSLNEQITAISQVCYINLRNLERIGSKLPMDLKTQLVHSNILSHIDYCNAVYGGLTEANIQRLQKIQNDSVRFIFNLYGSARRTHITPFLKKLHFLPVKYRIRFKITLLVFKCLNNMAPNYLAELINRRSTKSKSVRLDNDLFLLDIPPKPQYVRTEAAFAFSGPKMWNELPYNLRCIADIKVFKKELKTYYFNIAFNN